MRGHGIHAVLLGTLAFSAAGVLAAAVAVAITPACQYSKADAARSHLRLLTNAVMTHYLQTGRYPTREEGLQALVDRDILDKMPVDPWGEPFHYTVDGKRPVITAGARRDISTNDLK